MDLIFAEGITLNQINPHNFSLKNKYMDNLITTSMTVLPVIERSLENKQLKILKGFLSNSYALDRFETMTRSLILHTKGLALEISWDDFNENNAYFVAHNLFDYAKKNNIKLRIVIDINNEFIAVYYRTSKLQIVLKTKSKKYKIIKE